MFYELSIHGVPFCLRSDLLIYLRCAYCCACVLIYVVSYVRALSIAYYFSYFTLKLLDLSRNCTGPATVALSEPRGECP